MSKKTSKDEVIRCGYKIGDGAERDQGSHKHYADGGETQKVIKRDMGGSMKNGQPQPQQMQQQQQQMQQQQQGPQAPQKSQPTPQQPLNINYGLKKGGKAHAKEAVKAMLSKKETKPSAALIESITIMPKASKVHAECKEEGGVVKKAIGGTAKVRQGTFDLKGNPPIKR